MRPLSIDVSMKHARIAELKQIIRRWAGRDSAYFGTVISFPKAGRTWLRVMLDHLDVSMVYTHAGGGYGVSRHFADLPLPRASAGPGKQLFLFRDPRDTVISGYFQKTKRTKHINDTESIADFIRDPRYGIEKIIRFNLSWLEFYLGSDRATHRAINYEQLRATPAESLCVLYRYLAGREPASLRLIDDVVERTSFSKMQAQERSGEFEATYGSILAPTDTSDPESMKVRRGKIGGYIDYMSEVDVKFCDETMKRLCFEERLSKCSPILLSPCP